MAREVAVVWREGVMPALLEGCVGAIRRSIIPSLAEQACEFLAKRWKVVTENSGELQLGLGATGKV